MSIDIASLSNANITNFSTQMKSEESKTQSFQSVLEKAVADKDAAELREACVEFEGYFIQMMYKEMRKTVHSENGPLPKSNAEQIFQEMLDEEYSKASAKSGGIGLADMMYKQLSRNL